MSHTVFWALHCLSILAHLQLEVCEIKFVDFAKLSSAVAFLGPVVVTHQNHRVTEMKLIKPASDSLHKGETVIVQCCWALFDFHAQFRFQIHELNHWAISLFLYFGEILGHTRSQKRSKERFLSNLAKFRTVADYQAVLHKSRTLLR